MKSSVSTLAIANLLLFAIVSYTSAATSTFYSDLASFSAAAGGPLLTQDFSGYANGSNLRNVEILPGVSVDSNMNTLEAFFTGDTTLFGNGGRASGNAYYDVNLALPHRAASFEIISFEAIAGSLSTAQDAGLLTVFFTDATSAQLPINGNPTGDAIFRGVVSDTPISSIRWAEAHEGRGGNEETALDNFSVLREVPEPASSSLCCAMLLSALLAGRRRQAA
jgi:hypothetical protein